MHGQGRYDKKSIDLFQTVYRFYNRHNCVTVGQTDRQMDGLGDGWTPYERGGGDIKRTKVKLQKSDKKSKNYIHIACRSLDLENSN